MAAAGGKRHDRGRFGAAGEAIVKGLLARFFGGGTAEPGAAAGDPADTVEYNGYRIRPAPFRVEGQFQTAGFIEKDFPEGRKEQRFIRADKHGTADEAKAFAISKGRQIVDEQGDKLFESR
jgi:hypothetical protein